MDLTNIFLQSLLEAPGDNARNNRNRNRNNQNEDDPNAANEPDTQAEEDADTDTTDEGDENTDDNTDTEGTDEETGENDDTEQGTEDEGEETDEQNNEEENTDTEGEGENNEDDFSLEDPTGEGEGEGDDGPPPDGLTDPDDDGSSDDTMSGEDDPDAETNVHTNVLQLSKLDRLMAKRKCLNDFYDLRTSIDTFRVVIEKNEAILNPDVRDIAVRDLNKLYTTVGEYLTYRFGFTNYEENLQNYFLFLRSMNEIIRNVNEKGLEKTKSSRTDNIKD